ncbi:hypothetical protein [Sphingobacterium sp. JB170]|uniref:hypothetical protein n=1 Tax=Sphingobacterium sp. JB170 TaxID=1434842 RepID=UPI00097F0B53|nr:hypothetical protein [Sphingobacterium sp. JB170]SJN23610.1 hypothetical protein FM107_03950 [Sphingobacterium sp. JB170]
MQAFCLFSITENAQLHKPNIVFILADDLSVDPGESSPIENPSLIRELIKLIDKEHKEARCFHYARLRRGKRSGVQLILID